MKFMQILYPGLGGTSTVAFSIIDSQKKVNKKIKNDLIFYGVEKLTKNNLEYCKKNKINFSFFKKKNLISDNFKIYKKIKLIKPDIILSHSNSLFGLIFYKIINKKKFFCIDHTPDKTKTIKNWLNLILFSFFSNGIISVSEIKKNSLVSKFYNFFNIKYSVIRNGVNTDKFKRKIKILNRNKIYIGMAARFVDDKKQSLLINSIIQNKHFFKKNNFSLNLAGSGKNKKLLEYEVKKNKISNLIKFQGNLNETQLIKWFQNIDIYIHLSKAETTSTAILQALSMTNPVFASNNDGNIQLKKYTKVKNFYLIKNNDSSILNTLKFILKNRNMLKKVPIKYRKKYMNKISSNNLFNQYLNFINYN